MYGGLIGETLISTKTAATHPGVELRANLKAISHRCHLFQVAFLWELTKETIHEEVAFLWELTKETIHLPLGCLQGGQAPSDRGDPVALVSVPNPQPPTLNPRP